MSTASDDHYEGGVEYSAAIAAAAFAITMLDSSNRDDKFQNIGDHEASLDSIKSQKGTFAQTAKPDSESESSSDEEETGSSQVKVDSSKPDSHNRNEMPEKTINLVPSTRRRARFALNADDFEETASMKPKIDKQIPGSPLSPPPIKRRPTFSLSSRDLGENESIKPRGVTRRPSFPPNPPAPLLVPSTRQRRPSFSLSSQDFEEIESIKPKSKPSFPPQPSPPPPIPTARRRPASSLSSNNIEDIDTQKPVFPPPTPNPPRFQESEADAWERAELDKIKKRYEEMNLTILEWEDRRKRKAKGKLDRTEGDSGQKRAKALQAYQDDIERIRQITVGARAQAKEKQRNEELKVKAKADKYRATGQPPATCLCF